MRQEPERHSAKMRAPWPLIVANLSLLILYPIAWTAPLARAGLLPFFSGTELSIFSALGDLWKSDLKLALLVALFAVVAPYLKTIVLTVAQLGLVSSSRIIVMVEILGKLSMADVFLIALYIVITKGVGVGYVETAWGLWLFTGLVLASIALASASKAKVRTW